MSEEKEAKFGSGISGAIGGLLLLFGIPLVVLLAISMALNLMR